MEDCDKCTASVWTTLCCDYHRDIIHSLAESWARCCLTELEWAIKDSCSGCSPCDNLPLMDMTEHDLCIMTPPNRRLKKVFKDITEEISGWQISEKLIKVCNHSDLKYYVSEKDMALITNEEWLSNLINNTQQTDQQLVDFNCLKVVTMNFLSQLLPWDPNWLDEERMLVDIDGRFELLEIDRDYWDRIAERADPETWPFRYRASL